VLREARLVVDTRVGRERVYTVDPVPLQSVVGGLEGYRTFWQSSLARQRSRASARDLLGIARRVSPPGPPQIRT
jgi:hypothetical protein